MSNFLVLYASVTGNTELMANAVVNYLKQYDHNHNVDIKEFDVDKINVRDLPNYDAVLLGVYTWTDGELPFEVEDFYDELDDIDMTGVACGVFGSGDQFYDVFCGAVDIMYERMEEIGAAMIPIKVKADLDPNEEEAKQCKELAESVIRTVSQMNVVL
ncbi:flavodoxin [Oceanobacillus halophilus]|uniref:Flavodoxin n=1 Tax=Oceanobacillus halophilus TaxID=930130 RepID=A0A495A750_9BACI|nr:flavodoxin [Oceanobacillus halophilus]RKQ35608.1 flavodoxin [Oceanobacillus halophilus]